MVLYKYAQEQPTILEGSWHSLHQQQQQNPPDQSQQQQQQQQQPPPGNQQQQQQQTPAAPPDPFAAIDLDLLDEKQTAAITTAKLQYAEAVKQQAELKTSLEKTKAVASQYQSAADKAKAEIARLQPQTQVQQRPPEEVAALEILNRHGVKGEEAEKSLPFWTDMMKQSVNLAKAQIGHDLGPMAGTVLQQSATSEFTNARNSTPYLQDGEVAQEVWEKFVLPSLQQGQQVTAAACADYAKIVWVDKGKFNQQQQQPQNQQQPPVFQQQQQQPPAGGGFTFPGAQVLPPGNWQPANQQQQQQMVSPEVNSAVTAVFARLTTGTKVWPKGLVKPPGR